MLDRDIKFQTGRLPLLSSRKHRYGYSDNIDISIVGNGTVGVIGDVYVITTTLGLSFCWLRIQV